MAGKYYITFYVTRGMAIQIAAEEGRPQQKRAPAAIRIATFALMIMEIGTPAKGMVHCAR